MPRTLGPFLNLFFRFSSKIIKSCIDGLDRYKVVVTSIPATDTVIKVVDNEVINVEDRKHLFFNQTPQGFDYKTIMNAHKINKKDVTDDISLLDLNQTKCKIIQGSPQNIKITTLEDIHTAKSILNL